MVIGKKGALMAMLIPIFPGCMQMQQAEVSEKFDAPTPNIVRIGFAGDVMLERLVNEKITQVADYRYPWGTMLPYLKSTDLTIANLETTLTTSNEAVPKVFNFKADPDKVQALKEASIGIVNLANNHSLDFGVSGLRETIKVLDEAGIQHVGAGSTINEARKAAIKEIDGMRVGVIGYTDNEPGWLAGQARPGTNYIEVGDIAQVKKDIGLVRDKVDILVLTLHWGPNKRERPTDDFINFAHAMIDAGADIIHGHSAHVFQGVEIYKNRLIMYDTGDFVDDYAVYPDLRNDRSFFYVVELEGKRLVRLRLIPVLINTMQVQKAEGEDAAWSIARLKLLNKQFGTKVEISDGEAVILIAEEPKY